MKKFSLFVFLSVIFVFSCRVVNTNGLATNTNSGNNANSSGNSGNNGSTNTSGTGGGSGTYGSVMTITSEDDFKTKVTDVSISYNSGNPDYVCNSIADGIIVVDYYKDNCGNCSYMEQVFNRLAPDYKNVKFYKVRVWDAEGYPVDDSDAMRFAIGYLEKNQNITNRTTPRIGIYKNKQIVWGGSGAVEASDIEKYIK